MGIKTSVAQLLARAKEQGACFAATATIGRQSLTVPEADLDRLARRLGVDDTGSAVRSPPMVSARTFSASTLAPHGHVVRLFRVPEGQHRSRPECADRAVFASTVRRRVRRRHHGTPVRRQAGAQQLHEPGQDRRQPVHLHQRQQPVRPRLLPVQPGILLPRLHRGQRLRGRLALPDRDAASFSSRRARGSGCSRWSIRPASASGR